MNWAHRGLRFGVRMKVSVKFGLVSHSQLPSRYDISSCTETHRYICFSPRTKLAPMGLVLVVVSFDVSLFVARLRTKTL